MAKKIEVVVIHGSHRHADGIARIGDPVTLDVAELKALDQTFSFKKGIGDRFATPKAAEKLNLKRQLEEELEAPEEDDVDPEAEVEPEAVPPVVEEKPKRKGKKKAEG